jgi:hypothetical protein
MSITKWVKKYPVYKQGEFATVISHSSELTASRPVGQRTSAEHVQNTDKLLPSGRQCIEDICSGGVRGE